MSMADRGKQIDDDILQCKADILRARDILPPYDNKTQREPNSQKMGENTGLSASLAPGTSVEKEKIVDHDTRTSESEKTDKTSSVEQQVDLNRMETGEGKVLVSQDKNSTAPDSTPALDEKKATRPTTPQPEKDKIPRFDLAEQIMAEQRKMTAIRRKAPGQKAEAKTQSQKPEPIGYTIGQPAPMPLEQKEIITEIIARDIERLCRGEI